ncbi:MAG: DMT family transporter [Mogibacterium sp.]|nr:DMT family transporter [Mogibacterium sp.]
MTDRTKGNFALLIAALVWGSGFIAQKLGMAYIEPFTFNGSRQFIAGIVLIPYALWVTRKSGAFSRSQHRAEVVDRRRRQLLKASLICGLLTYIATSLQQIGLVTVSAGKSGFITAIYIVLVPLVGLLFGERSSLKLWFCVFLAMAGFALMSLQLDGSGITAGDLLTLLSAFFYALQIISISHFVTRNNAIQLATLQMLISGILGLITMALFESPDRVSYMASLAPLLYSALIPTAIGFTLQIVGQRYTDPTVASLIMSLEAVFALLLGALFLHERMILREQLGCIIIFAATILAQLPGADEQER